MVTKDKKIDPTQKKKKKRKKKGRTKQQVDDGALTIYTNVVDDGIDVKVLQLLELGQQQSVDAVLNVGHCQVGVICTVHSQVHLAQNPFQAAAETFNSTWRSMCYLLSRIFSRRLPKPSTVCGDQNAESCSGSCQNLQ